MRLINLRVINYILSTILLLESVAFLFCLPAAIVYDEPLSPFLWSSFICASISLALFSFSGNSVNFKVNKREGFLSVSLSWILLTLMGTLPFLLSGTIPGFIDAFFESTSGFTTTGASILKEVESLPKSILFWRSFTHWIGGLGVIVLVIVILPSIGMTASQLLPLESSLKEKIHPKTKAVGMRLLYAYLGLTLFEVFLLNLGEMDLFESICHTFGTVATGGFSVKNTSISGYSAYSQYIIMIFMLLSGVSFVVYYYLVKLRLRKIKLNDEFWFYIGIIVFFGTITTSVLLVNTAKPLELSFREGFFQTISIITTTGYVSVDYLLWPVSGLLIIFMLMFAGASTGSTTGSIKMVRHLVLLRNIGNVIKKLVHPSAVSQIKLNNKPLSDRMNVSIISFVILYIGIFIAGTIIIALLGTDLETAVSAVATSLGNTGPGLGSIGPMFNYSHMPLASKIIFSFLMIIGRLEIYTIFILFSKSFWKV